MNQKIQYLSLILSLSALSVSIAVALLPRSIGEKEREQIKAEVYQSILKDIDLEMAPLNKELGIKPPTDNRLSSRFRPFLEPLSK